MVAIIDYGVGNLKAIQNILSKVGSKSIITSDPGQIKNADRLILPGVGSFDYGIEQLHARSLFHLLEEEVLVKQKIVLGLCLGAQLMTESSEEGNFRGLGWVPAKTVKFDLRYNQAIPHMGWADVKFSKSSKLGEGIDEARFYFAHSFHFSFNNRQFVNGVTSHGYEFPSSFESKNIFGVQFHPEKSHTFGVKLFRNFLSL